MCAVYRRCGTRLAGYVSGQFGIGMVVEEAISGVLIDEPVVEQPLDGAALGAVVAEGVPDREQLGVLLVKLVLEPAEGAPALDGAAEAVGARSSLIWSANSAMSWYQTCDGSGSMPSRSGSRSSKSIG